MKLPTNSIRWRLQAWYGFLLLVAIAGFCLVTLRLAWIDQSKRLDRQIFEKERMMVGTLMRMERKLNGHKRDHDRPDGESPEAANGSEGEKKEKRPPFTPEVLELLRNRSMDLPSELIETFAGTESGYFYYVITDDEGNVLLASDNAPSVEDFPILNEANGWEMLRNRRKFRESVRAAPWGIRSVFGKEITPELLDMRAFMLTLGAVAGAFWLSGLWGGWWIAGRAIRPVKKISETAAEIAGGNLEHRIELAGTESELDQLGQVLNHTFDELQAAMDRQRQFTADASHELRTPLTVILSETQRILKKERTAEEYQSALEICLESGIRMKSLVEGLLLLARQERKTVAELKERCDPRSIVEKTIKDLRPLADEKHIVIEMDMKPVGEVLVDTAAMRILYDNLIGNAITHHPGNGIVKVRLWQEQGAIVFSCKDDGIGIAEEHLDKIFERFYQVDRSRSGATEHSGLGLALVKMIAENHGGSCEVESESGKGSCFTVRLPSDVAQFE